MKKGLKNEKAGTWLYQIAQGNKKTPTEAEKRIIDFLEKYSIDYEFQKPVRCTNGKGYILDFELTYAYKGDKHYHYLHQPIEVDGGYHHNRQEDKDAFPGCTPHAPHQPNGDLPECRIIRQVLHSRDPCLEDVTDDHSGKDEYGFGLVA